MYSFAFPSSRFGISSMLETSKHSVSFNRVAIAMLGQFSSQTRAIANIDTPLAHYRLPNRIKGVRISKKPRKISPVETRKSPLRKQTAVNRGQKYQTYLNHNWWLAYANAFSRDPRDVEMPLAPPLEPEPEENEQDMDTSEEFAQETPADDMDIYEETSNDSGYSSEMELDQSIPIPQASSCSAQPRQSTPEPQQASKGPGALPRPSTAKIPFSFVMRPGATPVSSNHRPVPLPTSSSPTQQPHSTGPGPLPRPATANGPSSFTMRQGASPVAISHQPVAPTPPITGGLLESRMGRGASPVTSSQPAPPPPAPSSAVTFSPPATTPHVTLGNDEDDEAVVPPPGARRVLSARGKNGTRVIAPKTTIPIPTKPTGPLNDLVHLVPAARENTATLATQHEGPFKAYLNYIEKNTMPVLPTSNKTFTDIATYAVAGAGSHLHLKPVEKKKQAGPEISEGFIEGISLIAKDFPQVWEYVLGLLMQNGYSPNDMVRYHNIEKQNQRDGAPTYRYQIYDDEWRVNHQRIDDHSFDLAIHGEKFRSTKDFYNLNQLDPEDRKRVDQYMGCIQPDLRSFFNDIVYSWAAKNKYEFERIAERAGWSLIQNQNKWLSMYEWVRDLAPEAVKSCLLPYMRWRYPRSARFADNLNGRR